MFNSMKKWECMYGIDLSKYILEVSWYKKERWPDKGHRGETSAGWAA